MNLNKLFSKLNKFSLDEILVVEKLANAKLPLGYQEFLTQFGGIELKEESYLSLDCKKGLVPVHAFYDYEDLNLEINNFLEEEDLIQLAPFEKYFPIAICHGQFRILMGNNKNNLNQIYLFDVEQLEISFLTIDLQSLLAKHIIPIKNLEGYVE